MQYYGLTNLELTEANIKSFGYSKEIIGRGFNATEYFGEKQKIIIREADVSNNIPEKFIMKKERRDLPQTAFYSYSKELGALTSIKDESGTEEINDWSISEKTVDGEIHRVYSKEIIGQKYFVFKRGI